jgi:hypothetical protein
VLEHPIATYPHTHLARSVHTSYVEHSPLGVILLDLIKDWNGYDWCGGGVTWSARRCGGRAGLESAGALW